jgi:hypothetical protein
MDPGAVPPSPASSRAPSDTASEGHRREGLLARLRLADERASDAAAWTANLAVFRVVFVAAVAIPAVRDALHWIDHVQGGLPEEAWRPLAFFSWIPMSVLADVSLSRGLAVLDLALLWAGLFGLATRSTLAAAALLSAYVLGLPQNQVKVTHNHHVVWFLALLAAGPSGRMLSIDAVLRAARASRAGRPPPAPASTDALPTLRFVWCLLGLVYLASGLAKLHAALAAGWASADAQRAISWSNWLERTAYEGRGPNAARFADSPSWLLSAGAWAAIAFEIAFLPAVLLRRSRLVAAAAGVGFHGATAALLRIKFRTLVTSYVSLVDWAALARGVRRRLGVPAVRPPPGALGSIARSFDVLQVLEPSVGDAAAPRVRSRAVLAVGLALVLGQAVVSGLRLVAVRTEEDAPDPESAARYSRWRWPFDIYPHFSRRRAVEEMQEVRLLLDDGTTVPLPPRAYASLFGPAAKTAWALEIAVAEPDADRRRARLEALVRALVERAPPELRARAVEASLVTVPWRVDRLRPVPGDERLELRLPLRDG